METKKILLLLLPFWTPLIPPMGISSLKSFLQARGYRVKTIDANIEETFRKVYDLYFDLLKQTIPRDLRGNFYNMGYDVMQNHMLAHINYRDETEYIHLVKLLINKNFFCGIEDTRVRQLNQVLEDFYLLLEGYALDILEKEKPGVLGLSVYKGTLGASLFVFRLARKIFPRVQTVMGGGIFADSLAKGSPDFDSFLQKTPYIDKIIMGEGELLFYKWLQGELTATQRVYTREDIKGQTLDISTLEIPDFSGFQVPAYSMLAASTSRSCPFQCSFCAETINWGKYRKKQASQVVNELSRLNKRYANQLFLMTDSLLNPIIDDLAAELTAAGLSFYWDGYLRADDAACDGENTLRWRRGGFYRARLGLESGSTHVLELMNKKINPRQIKQTLAGLAHAGIKTTTYWVIGHPGETEEDFRETLDLIEQLKDDIYEAECNPFRYYWSGQVKSGEWLEKNKPLLLYPESANDMLMLRTWIMDKVEPSREEIYSRVNRFTRHCNRLGIPNPYSWQDIYEADERWKKLHKNAVPSLVELLTAKDAKQYITENKQVKKLVPAKNLPIADAGWGF